VDSNPLNVVTFAVGQCGLTEVDESEKGSIGKPY